MRPSNSWSWRRGELDVWDRSEKVIRTVAKLMMLEFSNMVRKKGLKYLFIFVCANLLLLCQISRKFLLADHFWPIWGAPPPLYRKNPLNSILTKKHEINLILDPKSYIPWKEFWEKKRWRFALRATGRHLLVSIQTLVSSFHNSNLSPRFLENALFNLYNIW